MRAAKIPPWLRITAAVAVGAGISLAAALREGEWDRALGGIAVVAIATAAAWIGYRIGVANAQATQTYREGLGPKDFAMDLRVDPADLLYDLTVGFHSWDAPTRYSGLTASELANKLAEHNVARPANAIRGRYTRASDGLQVTWQPSTTDTTGDDR